MRRSLRLLIPIAALAGSMTLAGLYIFAGKVQSLIPSSATRADAIVVLTGGEDRVATGIELVTSGRGRRLLISGVHPSTGSRDLRRLVGGNTAFRCCVDLGHDAIDTSGNAVEARDWAATWGFRSLIVVTSNYHMPRSLAEFAREMPEVKLIPYPIRSRTYQLESWWQHQPTARLVVGEYLKFLASTARLAVSRVIGPADAPVEPRRTVRSPSPATPDARAPIIAASRTTTAPARVLPSWP